MRRAAEFTRIHAEQANFVEASINGTKMAELVTAYDLSIEMTNRRILGRNIDTDCLICAWISGSRSTRIHPILIEEY